MNNIGGVMWKLPRYCWWIKQEFYCVFYMAVIYFSLL